MTEAKFRPLGELTVNLDGKRVPVKEADRRRGSYPYYGASGVVDYVDQYLFDGEYLLIAEDGENLRTRQTPIAFMARGQFWVNNHAHVVVANDQADTKYLHYALQVADVTAYLSGSTMPKLTQGNLNRIPIPYRDRIEQIGIARILSSLDDKIELNRRMNETLEAMARALFKDWFVDFGPMRAKMEGRQPPGLAPEIAALFPDKLDAEGKPEGWRTRRLSEVCNLLNRGISPTYTEDGGILVLNQKCVRDGRVDVSKGRRHDPRKKSGKDRQLKVGDVLVNSTGVGTLGRVAPVLDLSEPTTVDSHVTIARASESFSANLLSFDLLSRQTEIEHLAEGSTGQTELSRTKLGALSVLDPPSHLAREFDLATTPLRSRVVAIHRESESLRMMRDALLPKLLSGELRIGDALGAMERIA